MNTNTKYARKYLFAIAILLIVILACVVLTYPKVAECSEEVVSNDLNLLANSDMDDYSVYTDQFLPDKIDRSNIKQYVPTDKFNTDRYIIYNGRNYGFIIFNDARTNHVLLFKEIITKLNDYEYEVEFKVLYTNAFFKSGNTIMNANSPYSIALSNINFSEFILDSHINGSITNFAYEDNKIKSPYFSKVGLSGDISFLDKDKTSDRTRISLLDVNSTDISDTNLAYNISNVTIDAIKDKRYLTSSTFNGATTPISVDLTTGYRKEPRSIELKMDAGADDFLANKDGKQDYLKARFDLNNLYSKNFYVYNNISFDICLYNAIQVKKEVRIASESVYSPTDNSTTQYGILDRSSEGYTLTEYQRFEPMLNNSTVLEFSPDKARNYKIMTPENYFATINDNQSNSENIFAVSGQKNSVGFTSELNKQSNIGKHGVRLIAEDFIDKDIIFANIEIKRAQDLKLGDTYLDSEIPTYTTVKMNEVSNNLFTLDTTGYTGNINLHILDEDINIIQTSTRYGRELVVNYPYDSQKKYYIVCDNQSYTSQALQFVNKGILEFGDKKYPSIENMYYKYTVPKYTQYYQTFAKQIFDDQGKIVPIIDGDALLEAGKTYYLQSGISRLMTNISDKHVKNVIKLNSIMECSQEYNEVFEFVPRVSAQYSFGDGTYDIYRNWTIIAEDVNTIYLNESEVAYQFVKRQIGGNFELDIDGEELNLGLNNLNQSSEFAMKPYVFNASEKMRIDYITNPVKNVCIYDAYLNLLEFDHGYPLLEGKNYIFIECVNAGTITIEEYLQKVNVELFVDGEKYDYDRDFYYGKDLILPVPTKDRHNFIGWRSEKGLVTDSNGQGLTEILEENMRLNAVWQLRGIVIKVTSNGEFWWNGQSLVKQETSPVFVNEDINSIYNRVVSTIESTPDCIAEGYYNDSYNFTLTSSNELNDYYSLDLKNKYKEKYKITFVISGQRYYMDSPVTYGDRISSSNFPQQVLSTSNREYKILGWSLSGHQKVFTINSGNSVEDYTPGVGSKNGNQGYTAITLYADVQYVSYKLSVNGNLYEIPRTSNYRIETLEDYGYNASNYYGYNVSFKNNKGGVYYIDDVVYVSDLYDFWTYGDVNVTIVLQLVANAIKVNITYLIYGDNNLINVDKNSNTTVYQGKTYTLSSVTARGWKFDCWKYNNNKITELTYSNLGVNRYYSLSSGIVLQRDVTTEFTACRITNPSSGTIRVDSSIGIARIYGNANGRYNYKFIIAPSIKEVTFVGGKWYDTSIEVEDEKESITLYFDGVYIKAKNNQCVMNSKRNIEILYSLSTAELVAGDVTEDNAQAAIVVNQSIAFGGEKFIIRGGNSKDAYKLASYGIKCDNIIFSAAKMLEVHGGNGASSTSIFGGHGGHGVSAIYSDGLTTITKQSQIICYGGNGGNATKNGHGGDGAVAVNVSIEIPAPCLVTYVPGKGGSADILGTAGKDGDDGYYLRG